MPKKKVLMAVLALIFAVMQILPAFANELEDKQAEYDDVQQKMQQMEIAKERARREAEAASDRMEEIVSELGKIGNIGLYPELVEWLLRFFLHDSKSNYDDLLRKAEAVNEKRINAIIWDRSFGLCGFAGKELKFFSVQTFIPWTELV